MEKSLSKIRQQGLGKVISTAISNRERILFWARVVELVPRVNLFSNVENMPEDTLRMKALAGSPIALAHENHVLREQGLAGGRIGNAMDFFGLNLQQVHAALCSCHYQSGVVTGTQAAALIRSVAPRPSLAELAGELLQKLWRSGHRQPATI